MHWRELPLAIKPDECGTIWSGSAAVDWRNSSGLGRGSEPPLVALYTRAGQDAGGRKQFTQCLASSADRGRTWAKYDGNPVLPALEERTRDPRVFWHEATGRWIMALKLAGCRFGLFRSADLKRWAPLSEIELTGAVDCPELFELELAGERQRRWVFWGGNGHYRVGTFDGVVFTPDTDALPGEFGESCYGGQTWNDVPSADGRRIFIAWMKGGWHPGMPFNQQLTFPRELSLHRTEAGLRVFAQPVRELAGLLVRQPAPGSLRLPANEVVALAGVPELFDAEFELIPGDATAIEIFAGGLTVVWTPGDGRLACRTKTVPVGRERLQLRLLCDRTSLEVFAQGGRYVMSFCFLPVPGAPRLAMRANSGCAHTDRIRLHAVKSIWRVAAGSAATSELGGSPAADAPACR